MITIILLLLLFWLLRQTRLDRSIDISYPDRDEFERVVDRDPYFRRMSPLDLRVRGVSTCNEYRRLYKQGFQHVTERDRKVLEQTVRAAYSVLLPYRRLSSIPWKFVKINTQLENSYPHTLGDIIVFNDNILYRVDFATRLRLAIHEKIHVYQRMYDCRSLFQQWGFQPTSVIHERARNNPDTDGVQYTRNGRPSAAIYKPGATTIADVVTLTEDHPNEIMAYELARILTGEAPSPELPMREWVARSL